MSGTSW